MADLAVSKSLEHNRSLKMMEKINKVVKWRNIEALLMEHYEVGTSKEGADAYLPLMLLKSMLLQKWFHIPSDPELENQINDRISFKKFLGLTLDKPSPPPGRRPLPGRRLTILHSQDSATDYPNKR